MRYTRGEDAAERALAEALTARRLSLQHRHGRRFSQQAVATRVGITRSNLCAWEHQIGFPASIARLRAWARALGLDLRVELD